VDPIAPQPGRGALGWVLGALLALGVIFALAALLNLGPFTDPELSRGELIARGDEICRKAHAAFEDLQAKPPQTPGQAVTLTDQLISIAEDERDELRSLNGPAEFQTELDRYLAAREQAIEAMRKGRDAAADRNNAGYLAAQAELAGSQLQRQRIARRIGFVECSRPLVGRDELQRQAEPPTTVDPQAPPTVSNPPTG
jgi:hypothetical protein